MTLKSLSEATQHHRADYYTLLLQHHALIIKEVALSDKQTVSKALHIHPTQFKGIFGCIVAYDRLSIVEA